MAVIHWVSKQLQLSEYLNSSKKRKQLSDLNKHYRNKFSLVDNIDFTGTKPIRINCIYSAYLLKVK